MFRIILHKEPLIQCQLIQCNTGVPKDSFLLGFLDPYGPLGIILNLFLMFIVMWSEKNQPVTVVFEVK